MKLGLVDRLTKVWIKCILTPDQWSYSTESCQEAKIDSDVLIREYKLISETRKVCSVVSSMTAQEPCYLSSASARYCSNQCKTFGCASSPIATESVHGSPSD